MIQNYQIRTMINGEEVLILYIQMNEEFSLEWFKNLKDISFKEYIQKNKILWNGTKVFLVVGGITLAVLTYYPAEKKEIQYISDTLLSPLVIKQKEKRINLPKGEVKQKEEQRIQTETKQENNIKKEQPASPKKDEKKSQYQQKKPNSAITAPNKVQETKPTEQNSSSSKEEQKDTTTYITVYRSNGQVIKITLEEYLIGVVAAEMPASFHIEALKAQSILARTYAMKAIDSGKKLTDTVSTQSYIDTNQMKKQWGSFYNTYYQKIKNAVESTKDLVVTYQGNLIDAVYHSTSNGKTEDSKYVWGNSLPYLKSVDSSWDKEASSYARSNVISKQQFCNTFGLTADTYIAENISRNASGRVESIKIGNQTYSGVEVRTKLGLRSTDFDITLTDNEVKIDTRGYGHGVGMSQYGANGLAKAGYNYQNILKHYYTNIQLISMF